MGLTLLNFTGKKTMHHCHQIIRSLKGELDLMKIYDQIIKEQENPGFIERVVEKSPLNNYQTHYLPHHHVKKDSRTAPIRTVYDCSNRMSNDYPMSLNDCLDVGCPLVNDLYSIIVLTSMGCLQMLRKLSCMYNFTMMIVLFVAV